MNNPDLLLALIGGTFIFTLATFFMILYQFSRARCSKCKKLKYPRQMYSTETEGTPICWKCKIYE